MSWTTVDSVLADSCFHSQTKHTTGLSPILKFVKFDTCPLISWYKQICPENSDEYLSILKKNYAHSMFILFSDLVFCYFLLTYSAHVSLEVVIVSSWKISVLSVVSSSSLYAFVALLDQPVWKCPNKCPECWRFWCPGKKQVYSVGDLIQSYRQEYVAVNIS